jgi:RimJ/RimL family protein N-acetyltransferase
MTLDHEQTGAKFAVGQIRDFRRLLEERAAERRMPTAHGVAVLADSTPHVYDANYLRVAGAAAAATVLAGEADEALAERHHRRVTVVGGGEGLANEFGELGYTRATHLVLVHERPIDRRVDTSSVRDVTLEETLAARTTATLGEPWGDEEIARQLNYAKERLAETVPTRFFATTVGGEVAGYCELRELNGVGQIEDVEVLAEFRGRGLGRALVQHALEEARRENDIVWLQALADDWPRELYAKLGFVVVDRDDVYTRIPHPLTRLILRTPRLELRLATLAEQRALYRVAEAGIHDPAEMPFEVPWTDTLNEEAFLAYHRETLDGWRPEEWRLNLVAFHDGDPIGSQGLEADALARTGTVRTGSWLGRDWQRKGLGTEMRAAVLTLAFEGLGVERARSGALAGNAQSLGVSRKLGYRVVGSHTLSPRGKPVEHTDLQLDRDRFSSPVPVEIEGLDRVRELFG